MELCCKVQGDAADGEQLRRTLLYADTPLVGHDSQLHAVWQVLSMPPSSHVTLLTILRARAAKPRVLRVSCRQASEGLMLATITVLALPPMESCKDSIYTIFEKKDSITVPQLQGESARKLAPWGSNQSSPEPPAAAWSASSNRNVHVSRHRQYHVAGSICF